MSWVISGWKEGDEGFLVTKKQCPPYSSNWLWQCVTNRGRMYATLGPNWRVPLRNSPRSRSYVYRYSEVGKVGGMLCHNLLRSKVIHPWWENGVEWTACTVSPWLLAPCWWKLAVTLIIVLWIAIWQNLGNIWAIEVFDRNLKKFLVLKKKLLSKLPLHQAKTLRLDTPYSLYICKKKCIILSI